MFVTRLVFCAIIATLFAPVRAAYVYTLTRGGAAPASSFYGYDLTSTVGTNQAVLNSRSFSVQAYANYGAVAAEAYTNCVGELGRNCNASAYAVAEFKDALTILGFGGYIEALLYYGSASLDGVDSRGSFAIGDQGVSWVGYRYRNGTDPASPKTIRFAFTANVPFMLFAHVEGTACQDGGVFCYSGSSDGEGRENFVQIRVLDLNNNPVTNFSYVTESGSPYYITGGTNASAPEPSTFCGGPQG